MSRRKSSSEEVLITWPSGGHNGGCLEFGKDGMLYISTGDGSGPNPPDGRTTRPRRLRPARRHPADRRRPQVGRQALRRPRRQPVRRATSSASPEIWAYGLRNPWKFGIDPDTGNIFAADNGWETWEMVHKIVRGGNCGWPVMEGRAALRTEVKPGPTPILPPVKDHPHTEANSVIGGPVYRGSKLPTSPARSSTATTSPARSGPSGPTKTTPTPHTTLVDTDLRIVAFTQGSGGELYVLDYDLTGQIYELVPSGLKDTSATFPRRLSETGLFTSLKTMEPAAGVVPYAVIVSSAGWTARAGSSSVAIPGDGRLQSRRGDKDSRCLSRRDGVREASDLAASRQAKTPIRLETQILHYESGIWRPYSYLWDDAGQGRDARRFHRREPTDSRRWQISQLDRTWHVNAVNECKLCHNAGPVRARLCRRIKLIAAVDVIAIACRARRARQLPTLASERSAATGRSARRRATTSTTAPAPICTSTAACAISRAATPSCRSIFAATCRSTSSTRTKGPASARSACRMPRSSSRAIRTAAC